MDGKLSAPEEMKAYLEPTLRQRLLRRCIAVREWRRTEAAESRKKAVAGRHRGEDWARCCGRWQDMTTEKAGKGAVASKLLRR
jgi:hypothetical protein